MRNILSKVRGWIWAGRDKITGFWAWFRQASLKKKIGVVLIVLVVLYVVTIPLRNKEIVYQTAPVTRGTVQETVSESGNIAANGQVGVSSNATGVIQELDVANGEIVTAGQTLFKVKATASPQEQASAYATYQNALSTLQTAQNTTQTLDATMWTKQQAYLSAQNNQNYKTNNQTNPETHNGYTDLEKQQIDSSVVQTKKDFDAAQQAYKTSNVSVSAAQAAVSSAKLSYQATQDVTVVAPIDGEIENLGFTVGDKVSGGSGSIGAAGTSGTTGTAASSSVSSSPVLYITTEGASRETSAVVQINEVDYPKIKQGQSADVTLPAIPNKKFAGHVASIDQLGTNTSSVISFNVSIAIDNPGTSVAPNMTVNVDINTAKHEDALTVPNSAVKPYKGGKGVQVFDKSKKGAEQVHFVAVKIGIKGIDRTEIISGVDEGTVVVTGSNAPKPAATTAGGATGS